MIPSLSVVILTHNRAAELQRTLHHMLALPENPAILVVDNASTDSTQALVRERFPAVRLLALERNIGAAARNIGAREAGSPYVCFCDDDAWWEHGALEHAVALLDAYPDVAVVCARIVVGADEREDPTCAVMASSPLPNGDLPGPAVLGFLAGACVVRREAFLRAGGYEQKFFIGGEEALLALDLVGHGWRMVYAPQLTVHHFPSAQRDQTVRKKVMVRNALWVAWMRLPLALLLRETGKILQDALGDKVARAGVWQALRELPWAIRRRKVISPEVARLYRIVHG
jgi:GT2 family glycosyltransferase